MKFARIILVLCLACSEVSVAADPSLSLSNYGAYVSGLLDDPTLRGASWSVLVYSLSGDSVVYDRDADCRLIPASVAKIVTSAAALDALGRDFRFETVLTSAGRLDGDGHLIGDLNVYAGGDPTIGPKYDNVLRAPVLKTWADSLRARGIRRIEGNLVLHTYPYRLQVNCPDWEIGDISDRFGPSVDGFSFNSNVCQLAILPGAFVGAGALLAVDPVFAPVEFRSTITTGPSGSQPGISFRIVPEDSIVYLSGDIPFGDDGEYLWISVQNPAMFFGRALHVALTAGGIEITGGVVVNRTSLQEEGVRLHVHRSEPLSEVIKLMNKESDNHVSEYVLRALGKAMNGVGDLRSGLSASHRFLSDIGVDDSGIYQRDGCGLARQNLCSARAIVELLKTMYVHPASDAYIASMAASGMDGTIGFRMSTPEMVGKVRAKTGTINHVSNLAGYLFGENGQVFLFAILCNNFPTARRRQVRAAQDAILERLYTTTAPVYFETDH